MLLYFLGALLYYFLYFDHKIEPNLVEYDPIGSRHFIIEHNEKKSWHLAEEACKQKGGHLAAIKDEKEGIAINAILKGNTVYWLGINDLEEKGDFVSVASGKKARFLNWKAYEPSYDYDESHCVSLDIWGMRNDLCIADRNFICQADEVI